MKVHTIAQRSPEWFALRCGKLTASRASDMLATIKSGEAAARRDLRMQLVCERITGQPQDDPYVSPAMQRGMDKEAEAFAAYEAATGELALPVGFCEHDELPAGCSPDGVVGDYAGLLEVKCPKSSTHLGYLTTQTVPRDYLAQITHALWITGAQWCDFVSFDDRFPDELRLFIRRVNRADVDLEVYGLHVKTFLSEVENGVRTVREMAAKVAA